MLAIVITVVLGYVGLTAMDVVIDTARLYSLC